MRRFSIHGSYLGLRITWLNVALQFPGVLTLIWLIVSRLLAEGSLLIWALMAGLSVMAFDTGERLEAWAFVLAVWAYPLFPLLMAIGAWVAFAFRKNRLAAVLTGLTFAPNDQREGP